jgi:tRNA(fMet)-specific endonuclease VapC
VLLDTDVFSFFMKSGDTRIKIYAPHVQGKLLAVSFITVGELLFGSAKKKWGRAKIADLNQRLRSVVIVPYDFKLCSTYGDLKAKLHEAGRGITDNDLWIASCAIRHSIPLISNNRRHFEGIPGLILISEAPLISEIESQGVLPIPGLEKI